MIPPRNLAVLRFDAPARMVTLWPALEAVYPQAFDVLTDRAPAETDGLPFGREEVVAEWGWLTALEEEDVERWYPSIFALDIVTDRGVDPLAEEYLDGRVVSAEEG